VGTPCAESPALAKIVKLNPIATIFSAILMAVSSGCALFPETRQRDEIHNPFPQLKRVGVLPFFNQSSEPTVDSDLVAEKYYAALQGIPGFEVLPIGVAKAQWLQYSLAHGEPRTGAEFQQLAKQMGVEALVVGSVTDFNAYYPPRLAMTVHWYAADEGFHPIPAGYGLPWGTEQEKDIPRRIAREAEFELARSQLATQTPLLAETTELASPVEPNALRPVARKIVLTPPQLPTESRDPISGDIIETTETGNAVDGDALTSGQFQGDAFALESIESMLPADWPEPTDLIPDPPSPVRPIAKINHEPVLSHTKLYCGDDSYFTNRLADHVETGDDARPGGWQGYLKRSDDFIRFCCHLHVTEMLESRGGRDQSDLILRWPLSRY
jgi:hypothetical protein